MPNKEFLEEYPLYRRFKVKLPLNAQDLPKIRIKMSCPICKSEQTFAMRNEFYENLPYANHPIKGQHFRARYRCTHCELFERIFFFFVDHENEFLVKIGQYPAWEIKSDPRIENLLGPHSNYYTRGLVCESQGYGIGAFGYYRRIVEEVIDGLLSEISELLTADELSRYAEALEKSRKTTVTQEKIDLVKDLLPPLLRPNGMNPLSVLHSSLSEGLHAESDEECLKEAAIIREILIFLVHQISESKQSAKNFTSGIKKLLERRSAKSS